MIWSVLTGQQRCAGFLLLGLGWWSAHRSVPGLAFPTTICCSEACAASYLFTHFIQQSFTHKTAILEWYHCFIFLQLRHFTFLLLTISFSVILMTSNSFNKWCPFLFLQALIRLWRFLWNPEKTHLDDKTQPWWKVSSVFGKKRIVPEVMGLFKLFFPT